MVDNSRLPWTTANRFFINNIFIYINFKDGSIDAERSSVSKIVSECDPDGQRTIFVLNKADLAEATLGQETVGKILSGKLFPMKSLAYFALVSGTNNPNSSIEDIIKYEENFFKKSKIYKYFPDLNYIYICIQMINKKSTA